MSRGAGRATLRRPLLRLCLRLAREERSSSLRINEATRGEALSNVQEAIEAYLESLKAHDEPIPPPIEEEVVEVAV